MSELQLVKQGNISYFLQKKINTGNIEINLTDLKSIWQINLSENELIEKFKKDNPLIKSSDKWVSEYISSMIGNTNTKIEIKLIEKDISIYFTSNISSLKTKVTLLLQLQPPEKIYKEITLPLLMVINELNFRQEKLLSLLKAKDVEIKEFKFEGATITRKNAITEPFNAVKFDHECTSKIPERAQDIVENPYSVICPDLNTLYTELYNFAATVEIKEEVIENNSNNLEEIDTKESPETKKEVKKETDLELKRKMSEALTRTKRTKKLYKI